MKITLKSYKKTLNSSRWLEFFIDKLSFSGILVISYLQRVVFLLKDKYNVILKQKQFMKLLIADIISRFGDSVDAIAYSWIIYETTGSRTIMAFIVGMNYLPTTFLTPFANALVLRLNKKIVMCVADFSRVCIVLTIVTLYSFKELTALHIIIATILTSTVEAFRVPASSMVSGFLLSEQTQNLGKNFLYTLSKIAELIGFSCVGIIIAFFGVKTALFIDICTFLISLCIVCTLKFNDECTIQKLKSVARELKSGFYAIFKSKELQKICALGSSVHFCIISLTVFQVSYAVNYIKGGSQELAYMKMALTMGIVLGAFILPKKCENTLVLAVFLGISSCAIAIFPIIEIELIKLGLIFVSMFSLGFFSGGINSSVSCGILQNKAYSLSLSMVITGMVSFTAFFSSFLSLNYQTTTIIGVFGVFVLVLNLIILIKNKINTKVNN